MTNEDMHDEECAGCGWAFADGGAVHETKGSSLGKPDWLDTYWICDPCHYSHGLSRMHEVPSRMELSQMTNLILKAIRDAAPTPPEETKG